MSEEGVVIKPCPFCGHTPARYHTRQSAITYSVHCVWCKATGPSFSLPNIGKKGMTLEDYELELIRQAIEAWNKRI